MGEAEEREYEVEIAVTITVSATCPEEAESRALDDMTEGDVFVMDVREIS